MFIHSCTITSKNCIMVSWVHCSYVMQGLVWISHLCKLVRCGLPMEAGWKWKWKPFNCSERKWKHAYTKRFTGARDDVFRNKVHEQGESLSPDLALVRPFPSSIYIQLFGFRPEPNHLFQSFPTGDKVEKICFARDTLQFMASPRIPKKLDQFRTGRELNAPEIY